jgi:hypothetical protein
MLTVPQLSKRLTSRVNVLRFHRAGLGKEAEIHQPSFMDIVWRGLLDFKAI